MMTDHQVTKIEVPTTENGRYKIHFSNFENGGSNAGVSVCVWCEERHHRETRLRGDGG